MNSDLPRNSPKHIITIVACLLLTALLLGGCAVIPIREQAALAKPSMEFASASDDAFATRTAAYLQPGTGDATGVYTTCSSCR